MNKIAVNRCLLLTAMMASSILPAGAEESKLNTNDFAAMDGMFESEFGHELDMPVVLTAARLRQSQLDAPASVTVIEEETIKALGFKDIEEIFRLVPGMLVAYHSGVSEKTASVAYHGTNLPEHRRLQVLIDGRSVYKPGLARVEWGDIPLAVEDIARIEVIRGPNAATYGANSYLGVINIISKHPQSEKGMTAKITGGMRDVQNTYLNIADTIGSTEFRWTIGSKQKSGFDVLSDGVTENRDGSDAIYTNLRTYTPLNNKISMEWKAGFKTGVNEQRALLDHVLEYLGTEDIHADDAYVWSKFSVELSASQFSHIQIYSEEFDRETEWRACFLDGMAAYLSGAYSVVIEDVCGDFSQSLTETKSEIEYQHTSLWNSDLRTVAGLRLRLDEFESETYNGGHSDNLNKSAFINAEYKIAPMVLLNAGGMYEKDRLNGEYFSPRLAFNFHLGDSDAIRVIYSEAVRAPDLFEQNGQTIYTIKNANLRADGTATVDQVVPLGTAETSVDFEKIYSHEISYFGMYPSINAQLDLKLFNDDLSGLISETLGHDKPLTNSNRLQQRGFEGQFKVTLTEFDKLALSFSYLDSDDDFASNKDGGGELTKDAERESTLTADRSGSLSWIHNYSHKNTLGVAYYHVENWNKYVSDNGDGYDFSRLDLNLVHHIDLADGQGITFQAAVQHRIDDDPLGRPKNNYTDKTFVFGSVSYKY